MYQGKGLAALLVLSFGVLDDPRQLQLATRVSGGSAPTGEE